MKIMLLLILLSLLLAAGFLLAYLSAARNGQFDDDYTPSVRMLFDNTVEGGRLKADGGKTATDDLPSAASDSEAHQNQPSIIHRQPSTVNP